MAIVGAGIGGLATALALRRAGVDAHVYERAGELRPLGAGLAMWANGTRSLRRLGVLEALRAAAGEPDELGLFDPRGRRLASIPTGEVARRLGSPMLVVERGPLQQTLLDAVGGESLSLGARVESCRETREGVIVRLRGGREERADAWLARTGCVPSCAAS